MPELLLEDVEPFLDKQIIIGSISRHSTKFPEVFIF
jgi:hypothetical protein